MTRAMIRTYIYIWILTMMMMTMMMMTTMMMMMMMFKRNYVNGI